VGGVLGAFLIISIIAIFWWIKNKKPVVNDTRNESRSYSEADGVNSKAQNQDTIVYGAPSR
jgi:hypothetical protein